MRILAAVLIAAAAILVVAGLWRADRLPDSVNARLYPLHYQHEIAGASARYEVDPYLVAAVVKTESNFRPGVVSKAGAIGLMQVMPETAAWIVRQDDWDGGAKPDLKDPGDNLALGSYYLAFLLDRFEGNLSTALAAYNAGHGKVERWLEEEGADSTGSGAEIKDFPVAETRGFVSKVERYLTLFKKAHPHSFNQ